MTPWHELEEDQTVNRDISSSSRTNDSPDATESDEVLRPGSSTGENTSDEKRRIESWLSTDEIGRHTPKECTDNQTDIVGDRRV